MTLRELCSWSLAFVTTSTFGFWAGEILLENPIQGLVASQIGFWVLFWKKFHKKMKTVAEIIAEIIKNG